MIHALKKLETWVKRTLMTVLILFVLYLIRNVSFDLFLATPYDKHYETPHDVHEFYKNDNPHLIEVNLDLMGYTFDVPNLNSGFPFAVTFREETLFRSKDPVKPLYFNENYIVCVSGPNSMKSGFLRYLFLPAYTDLIVIHQKTNRVVKHVLISGEIRKSMIYKSRIFFLLITGRYGKIPLH